MSVESIFYVQLKQDNEWVGAPLYKENNDFVDFWLCGGDVATAVKFLMLPMHDANECAYVMTKMMKEEYEEKEIEEELIYQVSYGYILHMADSARENENVENEIWKDAVDLARFIKEKVAAILGLTDYDYIHPDNVRIVCFISY